MVIESCRIHTVKNILAQVGQQHILTFFDQLSENQKEKLLTQIEAIDWRHLAKLIDSLVKSAPDNALPNNLKPAPWYPAEPGSSLKEKYDKAKKIGDQLISSGKVAAFTVAGGQGTRLGWSGPKGTFPATPIRQLSLFGVFGEYLKNINRRYNTTVPWYLMTNQTNHEDTVQFFEKHKYFGLGKENVFIFVQGMLPAIDMQTGKALLASPDSLALSPNGHGGTLQALYVSGALGDMRSRGVEQISYFQVDNPLVRCVDPLFIGLHVLDQAQMSSKMLPKREPKEKLGNFCLAGDKMTVIEYSDLPDELAFEKNNNDSLKFSAGSIAIHVIAREFVEQLNKDGSFHMPFHRAQKKVSHVDLDTGAQVKPDKPNAVKLETFVFDALPLCKNSIILETDRVEEFAPIKNADSPTGQPPVDDSPASSKQLQTERAARWLELRGVQIPRNAHRQVDAILEISQETTICPQDFEDIDLPQQVESGAKFLL